MMSLTKTIRGVISAFALSIAPSLAVAGDITHEMGVTTVPDHPERIVVRFGWCRAGGHCGRQQA